MNIINLHLQSDHFPTVSGTTKSQFVEALYPRDKLSAEISRLSQKMWRHRTSDPDSDFNITLSYLVEVGHLYVIGFDRYAYATSVWAATC